MSSVSLRPATAEDESFLFDLYCAVRAPEFALLPLPPEQKNHLIAMQYAAQRNAYRAEYPGSSYEIVLEQGRPVGRIWIARLEDEFHLVDIALLPQARNAGIGTMLMKQLQAEARRAGKPVRSSIFQFNPGSLRFHQRLGFQVTNEDEIQCYMEWTPGKDTEGVAAP